ncbi:O-antigen ligase family protein [Pandoraea communis]|uniref:O-antigen ligase family protein n=1 Tax=Pandoraea communis TaxID=2508297 RepID=UPI0025A4D108|nr:O-antigen ligase family protein [Pandoraea communis]MDM8358894.1 O-antigen ligase family protein [Pandoraea communis]
MSTSETSAITSSRHLFAKIFGTLILLFPAAALVVPRGGNTVMFFIVALGAAILLMDRKRGEISSLLKLPPHVRVLVVALFLPFFAILTVEVFHGKIVANTLDSPVRFLLATIVFFSLRRIAYVIPKWVDLTFGTGAICAAAMALYSTADLLAARAESSFLNPIHFGDIALLLGILSLVSIHWLSHDKPWIVAFKILGAAAGCYASWASQSRGGWIALPCLLLVWFFWHRHPINPGRRVAIALIAVVLLISAFASSTVRERFESIRTDLTSLSAGQPDSSIGIRLELWKTAGKLIEARPLLGSGAHGYRDAMPAMAATGVLTPMAADYGKGEVHNQILAYVVDYGLVFGLLSILGVYAGPAYFFIRSAKIRHSPMEHRAALMGLMTAVAFAIFGLTVETFNLKVTVAFYSMMVALFAAFAYPVDNSIDTSDDKIPAAP